MIFKINPEFESSEKQIRAAFRDFDSSGSLFLAGDRNTIKIFEIGDGIKMNVKSFKIPNIINRVVYRHFRKSKARRSFEYAHRLINTGINTPTPIAFQENHNSLGLTNSYYASIHQSHDFTLQKIINATELQKVKNILRQFSQFTYQMHEAGIEFKDHSPGNTLIKKIGDDQYQLFLVDLNRMKFHDNMNLDLRMKSLSRLTKNKEMLRIITDEYAHLANQDPELLFETLWNHTQKFQNRFNRKQTLKNKLKPILERSYT